MVRTYKPKPQTKTMQCRHCDGDITVGWKTKKKPAHIECSIKAAIQSADEMHNKSGPTYEKWRQGMASFLAREGIPGAGGSKNLTP